MCRNSILNFFLCENVFLFLSKIRNYTLVRLVCLTKCSSGKLSNLTQLAALITSCGTHVVKHFESNRSVNGDFSRQTQIFQLDFGESHYTDNRRKMKCVVDANLETLAYAIRRKHGICSKSLSKNLLTKYPLCTGWYIIVSTGKLPILTSPHDP